MDLQNEISDVQLSEKLESLDIMGPQLRVPLKPFERHSTMVPRGLEGASIRPPL